MSETIHASTVAIQRRGVLIVGASGRGKSDLALRLIDRGAMLVSDDYTVLEPIDGRLRASPPANIAGQMEIRGVGIVAMESVADVPVWLLVDLDHTPQRMPESQETATIAGVAVPLLALDAHGASAPIKVELALKALG